MMPKECIDCIHIFTAAPIRKDGGQLGSTCHAMRGQIHISGTKCPKRKTHKKEEL